MHTHVNICTHIYKYIIPSIYYQVLCLYAYSWLCLRTPFYLFTYLTYTCPCIQLPMYVYLCMCINTYMCMYICLYMYTHMCSRVCVQGGTRTQSDAHEHGHAHMHIHTHTTSVVHHACHAMPHTCTIPCMHGYIHTYTYTIGLKLHTPMSRHFVALSHRLDDAHPISRWQLRGSGLSSATCGSGP